MSKVLDVLKGVPLSQQKQRQVSALDAEFEQLQSDNQSLKSEIQTLRAEVNPLKRENERLKERLSQKTPAIDMVGIGTNIFDRCD